MAFEIVKFPVLWRLNRNFHYICIIKNCMIMVDKRVIEQVLAEQYEELVALQEVDLCAQYYDKM